MSSIAHEVEWHAIGPGHHPAYRLASSHPARTGGCLVPEVLLRLAEEFTALGHGPDAPADLGAALERATDLAVHTVAGAQFAGITTIDADIARTVASTDELVRRVDELQYTLNEGPSLTAITEHRAYVVGDLAREPRWPRFSARAVDETGVLSVLVLRLEAGCSQRACLNLYATEPAAFPETSIATGALLAAQLSSALTAVRAKDRATNLEKALRSNRQIGAAIGILMALNGITEGEAFTLLRTASQHLHRKLRDVIADVVHTGAVPTAP